MLEGKPSAQSGVIWTSFVFCCVVVFFTKGISVFCCIITFPPKNLKNSPSIMLLRYHASLLGWYCAEMLQA